MRGAVPGTVQSNGHDLARRPVRSCATTLCGADLLPGEVPGSDVVREAAPESGREDREVSPPEAAKKTFTATFSGGENATVVHLHEDTHGAVSLSVLVNQSGGEDP